MFLFCDALHEVVDIVPSIAVIVVVLQPSVAVAEPRAASRSEAEGLQPSVVVVPLAVMDGPLRSRIHVTVAEAVAELPQPSEAVNVLVCDARAGSGYYRSIRNYNSRRAAGSSCSSRTKSSCNIGSRRVTTKCWQQHL